MKKIEEKYYAIWLSLIDELGIKKYTKLIEKFQNIQGIWNAKYEELLKVQGIGEKLAKKITNENTKKEVKKHLEYMTKNKIEIISIWEKEYPYLLKNIVDSPISIYVRGNKEILNNIGIAIIGCREATEYGIKVAKKIAYELAKEKITIISGLAKGIDSASHLGAIYAKEKTIAVLGNGLDMVYPSENLKLAKKILEENGAIISEYPLGTKPNKINFPARNRIISGLSRGILVVEAKEKSGTLITVDFALEQGKDIFVIPGNIDSKNSYGTNELIKQGAKLVTNSQEIIEEYNKMC